MEAGTVRGWSKRFGELANRVGPYFARHDLRFQATGYLRGLLGSVERKNSWQLSEHLGHEKPYGIQRLLGRASWDAHEVRDELLRYASENLIGPGDAGVLIVDETGFLKKGDKSVGVQRQYSGTAGRIENCQIGVFLALSASRVRLGGGEVRRSNREGTDSVAAHSPEHRDAGTGVLSLHRAKANRRKRPGDRRGAALGNRSLLRNRETGDGAG